MQATDAALMLIQTALAPVFLIVGIGTLLNVITARLSRIVDRVRWFESPEKNCVALARQHELKALSRRMRWANTAVNLLTGAAVIVCINIFLIMVEGYFSLGLDAWILGSFASSVVLLSFGMLSFFAEVSVATASLKVTKSYISETADDDKR
ncbi:DUF2721 domain-containing protein [Ningiella sp. W23]|uniref:DUF2721 domain-containing protein n=1 Tax=Ningiella sp. W23 TaxID=3023715 RepID=UPI003757B6CA